MQISSHLFANCLITSGRASSVSSGLLLESHVADGEKGGGDGGDGGDGGGGNGDSGGDGGGGNGNGDHDGGDKGSDWVVKIMKVMVHEVVMGVIVVVLRWKL